MGCCFCQWKKAISASAGAAANDFAKNLLPESSSSISQTASQSERFIHESDTDETFIL